MNFTTVGVIGSTYNAVWPGAFSMLTGSLYTVIWTLYTTFNMVLRDFSYTDLLSQTSE